MLTSRAASKILPWAKKLVGMQKPGLALLQFMPRTFPKERDGSGRVERKRKRSVERVLVRCMV